MSRVSDLALIAGETPSVLELLDVDREYREGGGRRSITDCSATLQSISRHVAADFADPPRQSSLESKKAPEGGEISAAHRLTNGLAYLNGIEKLNCTFCSYANGLIAYVRRDRSRASRSR